MKLYGIGKGYGRQVSKVICKDCGVNCNLLFDELNEVYLCEACIESEQNELDDKEYKRNEELDNEKDS